MVDPTKVNLKYGTSSGNYGTTLNMTNTSGYDYSVTIPASTNLSEVFFIIEAEDSEATPAIGTSVELSYKVRNPVLTTIPYEESFETPTSLGDCYVFNAKGDTKEWYQYEDGNGNNERNFEQKRQSAMEVGCSKDVDVVLDHCAKRQVRACHVVRSQVQTAAEGVVCGR